MSPKTPPWSSLSQEFNNLNDQKIKYETTKVLFIKNYNLKNPSGSHLLDLGWSMEGPLACIGLGWHMTWAMGLTVYLAGGLLCMASMGVPWHAYGLSLVLAGHTCGSVKGLLVNVLALPMELTWFVKGRVKAWLGMTWLGVLTFPLPFSMSLPSRTSSESYCHSQVVLSLATIMARQ